MEETTPGLQKHALPGARNRNTAGHKGIRQGGRDERWQGQNALCGGADGAGLYEGVFEEVEQSDAGHNLLLRGTLSVKQSKD